MNIVKLAFWLITSCPVLSWPPVVCSRGQLLCRDLVGSLSTLFVLCTLFRFPCYHKLSPVAIVVVGVSLCVVEAD